MSARTITIPAKFGAVAKVRASERGCRTIEEYVQALIEEDSPAPIGEQLEKHLLKSIASPARQVTRGYWAKKRKQLRQNHRRSKGE